MARHFSFNEHHRANTTVTVTSHLARMPPRAVPRRRPATHCTAAAAGGRLGGNSDSEPEPDSDLPVSSLRGSSLLATEARAGRVGRPGPDRPSQGGNRSGLGLLKRTKVLTEAD